MKKLFVLFAVIAVATSAHAQQPVYTDSSLSKMSKMDLTEIYLGQVEKLATAIPYAPFTLHRDSVDRANIDMPNSRYLNRKRTKVERTSTKYSDIIKDRMYEVVPYSDKKDIIAAILFIQRINGSLK